MSSRKKLTLSVDEQVIEHARRYSQRHNTSISQLVSNYLAQLGESSEQRPYSPAVQRLLGILPSDISIEDYHKHIEKKHSL